MNFTKPLVASVSVVLLAATAARAQGRTDDAPALALKGYDVVAYFKQSRASKGSPEFRRDFDGARYYFASAEHQAAFSADPDRFLPQFRGHCSMGISLGKKIDADPTLFKIIDGKLYVFSSRKGADAADQDPEVLARARQNWPALK